MKTLLMLAAASAAILPMTAQAAPKAEGVVTYKATNPNACAIYKLAKGPGTGVTEPTYPITPPTTGAFAGSADGAEATVTFENDELFNPASSFAKGHTETVVLGAFCNYTHNVQLVSQNGGLINNGTSATGNFGRRINYTADITGWDSVAIAALDTTRSDRPVTNNSVAPKSGTKTESIRATDAPSAALNITMVANDSVRWLAGDYEDVLTIRLGTGF